MSETIMVAIISAALGGGGFVELVRWLIDRRSKNVHRGNLSDALELALKNSATLKDVRDHVEVNSKRIRSDHEHFESVERQLEQLKQILLRHMLFTQPHDRVSHEAALDAGKEYIASGGNGAGHVRLEQLQTDYARRLRDDDWIY